MVSTRTIPNWYRGVPATMVLIRYDGTNMVPLYGSMCMPYYAIPRLWPYGLIFSRVVVWQSVSLANFDPF